MQGIRKLILAILILLFALGLVTIGLIFFIKKMIVFSDLFQIISFSGALITGDAVGFFTANIGEHLVEKKRK